MTKSGEPSPVGRPIRTRADRSGSGVGWVVHRARTWWLDPGRQGSLLLVGLALAAAVVVAYLTWQHRARTEAVPLAPPAPAVRSSAQPTSSPTATRSMVVAVAGKVRQPGIVTLPVGARVIDAIRAAGGVAPGADAGLINLARPLADGEQVVVGLPAGVEVGCPGCAGSGRGGGDGAASGAVPPETGPVNLNAATTGELDALPGVGPVTAQRIVDWRRAHGRFDTVDQLREVDGIGPAKFERLRPRVVI